MARIPPLDTLLCFNTYALNLAFGRFYQAAFSTTGFTYPKLVVLMALKESGPMSLSDLSARVGTEANTLSPLVKKMSNFGVIDRVRDTQDERRVMLTLLPFGEEILQEALKILEQAMDELGLDSEEIVKATKVLAETRAKLENAKAPAKLNFPTKADG